MNTHLSGFLIQKINPIPLHPIIHFREIALIFAEQGTC
jgi:hypothetical protein